MNLIAYIVLGRLLTWFAQTNGWTRRFWRLHPFVTELGECDFCVGVWIFAFLAWLTGMNVLPVYFPVVSELITGIVASFATHLMRIGYETQYGTVHLE